jgi:hypothetical protein
MVDPRPILRWSALAVTAVIGMTGAAPLSLEDTLYERAAVLAADARCGLFDSQTRAALEAARSQSRSAMIRSGAPASSVASVERFAAQAAGGWACNSADMKAVATRVRNAFGDYQRLAVMRFPGDQQDWVAEKYSAERAARWRVWQATSTPTFQYRLGIAEKDGKQTPMLVLSNATGLAPTSVVVMVRDFKLAPRPVGSGFLKSMTFKSTSKSTPLYARAAPQNVTQPYFASGRAAADTSLLPPRTTQGLSFSLPQTLMTHMESLDPREAIEVRITLPGTPTTPERIERCYFEVGDFAAARAFIRASS